MHHISATHVPMRATTRIAEAIVLFLAASSVGHAGPVIREFMASNVETLADGDGLSSDWIEIYNDGADQVNLEGWALTDNADNPGKWLFPSIELAPGARRIIFASGRPDDNHTDAEGNLRTGFRLSSGGEYLALIDPAGNVATEFAPSYPPQFNDVSYGAFRSGGGTELVLETIDARFLVPVDATFQDTWMNVIEPAGAGFVQATGTGLGFEASGNDFAADITTNVIEPVRFENASTYVRYEFPLPADRGITGLRLRMKYDDGFVAFLNGTEIASANAPAELTWGSTATSGHRDADAVVFEEFDVADAVALLGGGINVLAIQAMNTSASGSDFLIRPELEVTFAGDGPLDFGYFLDPTPGAPNGNSAANPGPLITLIKHAPEAPAADAAITINCRVDPRMTAVTGVALHYRVMHEDDTVTVPMRVTGNTFTALIPGGIAEAGAMVRWFITATDEAGNNSRAPAFLDTSGQNQSAEYFGTVIADPGIDTSLPVFQWFAESTSRAHRRSGARVSVYYGDRFYDNVFARQRGGATNGSVSQKFEFNNGESLHVNEDMPALREINLNGNGSDPAYVRQVLAFESFKLAGNQGSDSFLVHMRDNGGFDRVGVFVEQPDDVFLERHGFSRFGELYKFVQRGNLNPALSDTSTGIERQNGNGRDLSSAKELVAALDLPTQEERMRFVFDHFDLPQMLNYLAIRSIIQDADDVRKNFYMYRDGVGDERWRIFPWDKDWSFGITGDGGRFLKHPFFGDFAHRKQNANQWNVLYEVMFNDEPTQRLYLRWLQSLTERLLQPEDTPEAERIFETRVGELFAEAGDDLPSAASRQQPAVLRYFSARRRDLFETYGPGGSKALLPGPQPENPRITIANVEAAPVSGNQDEEFVRLANAEDTEIDISGWMLAGAVNFTFASGTVIPRAGELFASPDTRAFRNRETSPRGGESRLVVGGYQGRLSRQGETLRLIDREGHLVHELTYDGDASDVEKFLTISEIMYHPADPNADAEFIELLNTSDTTALDLTGVTFTAGITFDFTSADLISLAPGARLVIVRSREAFRAVYGDAAAVAGQFTGSLDGAGESIRIADAEGRAAVGVRYNDAAPWPVEADGGGHSLVLAGGSTNDVANWRLSTAPGGSPGTDDSLHFIGDPLGDDDRNGVANLLQYATATGAAPRFHFDDHPDGRRVGVLEFDRVIGSDDAIATIESAAGLNQWADTTSNWQLSGSVAIGNSIQRVTFTTIEAVAADVFYFRIRFSLRQ